MAKTYWCEKCRSMLAEKNFYASNNTEKYPNDGKLNMCKKCITMHVDNWDPSTYTWILEEVDVPYIPEEWNKLMLTWARDPSKVTGTTILGRYLSKMKLNQWKDYRWSDTEHLQKVAEMRVKKAMEKSGYEAGEIAEAIELGKVPVPEKSDFTALAAEESNNNVPSNYYNNQVNNSQNLTDEQLGFVLTDEETIAMAIKWGKGYRVDEWIQLEKLYMEMMESYDIQTAAHVDTLKLLCKTSLKANQLIDIGDVEGFQKMSRVYDTLMKNGKFTAAQNKQQDSDNFDAVCAVVALCEKEGFIPRYYVDKPQDRVDMVIKDMQLYTKTLINEELGLGELIQDALKGIQLEHDRESKARTDNSADEETDLFEADTLKDEDIIQFKKLEEEKLERDDDVYKKLEEAGEL